LGAFTWFDFVIVGVIVISAIMSTGRGLVREATSVISFIVGFIVAGYTLTLFKKPLEDIMPDSWGSVTPSAILVVVGFLAAYTLAAWLGGRVSKLIHSSPEIGVLDRLAGAAFGVVRGALAGVLFVLLMQQVLPEEGRPQDIVRAQTYSYLNTAAEGIRKVVPGFLPQAVDAGKKVMPGRSNPSAPAKPATKPSGT
jgi:membrane protein required for colicin V production